MEQLRTCGFSFTHVRTPRPHKHASTVRTPSNARTHSHPSVSARRHRRELPHRQNGDLVRVCTLHIVPAHMCFVCACARYVRVVARRLFLCVHRAHICVREIVCACVPGLTLVWQQLRSPHHTKKRPHKIIKCQPTTSTHVNFNGPLPPVITLSNHADVTHAPPPSMLTLSNRSGSHFGNVCLPFAEIIIDSTVIQLSLTIH